MTTNVTSILHLLSNILASAFIVLFTNAFTAHHHTTNGHSMRAITSATVTLNYPNTQEGDGANDNPLSLTSIGDVVKNLHGGKYQFSETQYLAGGSFAGQQFAESLYSLGGVDESLEIENDGVDELPKWAMRLQNSLEQSAKPVMATLLFDKEKSTHAISIKNDERSWERYYAFILPNNNHDDCGLCGFRVSPATGSLAPRGGASNVCDESKPYSDSAVITMQWSGEDDVDVVGPGEKDLVLVVGTEAEVWRYRLSIA